VAGIASIKDIETDSVGGKPRWILAIMAVVAALGYAVYEWRREIGRFGAKILAKLPGKSGSA